MNFLAALLVSLLPAFARADSVTAFNIDGIQCSTNAASLTYASCGMSGNDPCQLGDKVTLTGSYSVTTSVPQEVTICAKVKAYGVTLYKLGCDNVNICDFIDCSSSSSDGYLDSSNTYDFDFDDLKIPGDSHWLGSGWGVGFVIEASNTGSNEDDSSSSSSSSTVLETCKLTVSATSISTSAGMAALASIGTAVAAALYYRKKRRTTAIIDLNAPLPVEANFVEMSHTGVSV